MCQISRKSNYIQNTRWIGNLLEKIVEFYYIESVATRPFFPQKINEFSKPPDPFSPQKSNEFGKLPDPFPLKT
jgi:hypothetical protein